MISCCDIRVLETRRQARLYIYRGVLIQGRRAGMRVFTAIYRYSTDLYANRRNSMNKLEDR
jgi:hypothetical protein